MKARFWLLVFATMALATTGWAQGSLTPTGAPSPTMKSLQEIWEALSNQQSRLEVLQDEMCSVRQENSLIMLSLNVNLPWEVGIPDSTGFAGFTSLAFGPDGQPAISYYDASNADLKFARYDRSSWSNEVLDSDWNVGEYTSLAFGPDGQPAISYYDNSYDDLKFARYDGSSWSNQVVDSDGYVGFYTSLAFGPGGQPNISYYDSGNGDLKFARYDGSSWSTQVVDSSGDVGLCTSLAFGPNGHPAISYCDGNSGDLKFACRGLFEFESDP